MDVASKNIVPPSHSQAKLFRSSAPGQKVLTTQSNSIKSVLQSLSLHWLEAFFLLILPLLLSLSLSLLV